MSTFGWGDDGFMYQNRCKHCFNLFTSRIRTGYCPECAELDEIQFDRIVDYLKEYPNSNALQISENLNMDLYNVIGFMNEGRLQRVSGKFSRLED